VKKYLLFLSFINFLHAEANASLTKIQILFSRLDEFCQEISEELSRVNKQSGLKKTGKDITGTIQTEKKPEGPKGIAGSLSSIIKKESSREEESSEFDEEDPLQDIRNEVTAYTNLMKSSVITAEQTISTLNSLLVLKDKAWKINKKDKEIDLLRLQIQQLIDVFTFLNTLIQRTKKLDTDMKAQDTIASLLQVAQNFDQAKKSGLSKIPDSIKNNLQIKLDALQPTVTDKSVLTNIDTIRTSLGLSKFKPAVPEKPKKPASKKPELPAKPKSPKKPEEAKKTGSLLQPGTLTPMPVGDIFGAIKKNVELKPAKDNTRGAIDFASLSARVAAETLNKFRDTDFEALSATQLVAIAKKKDEFENGLLDPEVFESIAEAISNKLKEPNIDPNDRIQLRRWAFE
jgi:hypothetical protein